MEYLRWILFCVVALTCILFFYYLRKEKIITNTVMEAYEALDEASVKSAREAKRNILIQENSRNKGTGKLVEWPRQLYIYSGLNRVFSSISFEMWSVIILASTALVYFVVLAITQTLFSALVFALLYFFLIILVQKILAFRNYKIVDEELLKFLNILENYSITNTEIISVFLRVSHYVPEPLKSVLEECYYDAQTSGDKSAALYALSNKIEHPKFKEFICNIEICVNYSANYKDIIERTKQIVMDEQKFRRERRSIANAQAVNMLLVSGGLLFALVISDSIISGSIWEILFHTPIGRGCMAFVAVIYAYFYYKIATVER
uniref:type II secretion system F family protein n=1 Tax=Acetatifactor sp. TaxID=1872090 RepID=UPI004056E4DE